LGIACRSLTPVVGWILEATVAGPPQGGAQAVFVRWLVPTVPRPARASALRPRCRGGFIFSALHQLRLRGWSCTQPAEPMGFIGLGCAWPRSLFSAAAALYGQRRFVLRLPSPPAPFDHQRVGGLFSMSGPGIVGSGTMVCGASCIAPSVAGGSRVLLVLCTRLSSPGDAGVKGARPGVVIQLSVLLVSLLTGLKPPNSRSPYGYGTLLLW
jgi:hypothetical protein